MAVSNKHQVNKSKTGVISTIILCVFLSLIVLISISLVDWYLHGFNSSHEHLTEMYINNKVISDELNGYSESIFNHFNNEKLNGRFDFNKNLIEEKALMAAGKGSSYLDEIVGIKGSSKIHTILNKTRVFWVKIISIFTLTLKVAFVKILMMLSSIPLFAILGFVGLVDGLSQREIRRAELGRESSYLFHMLRKWVFRGIILLVLLWIAAPFSIQPQVIFLPMSVLFAFMISLTAQRFKKYL